MEAARSRERVAVDLATQQDEDASCNGEDCQYDAQATQRGDQCEQAIGNEKDGQQEHTNISCDFHDVTPFQFEKVSTVGSFDLCQPLEGNQVI